MTLHLEGRMVPTAKYRLPLYLQTIIAMALGVAAGLYFGPQLDFLSHVSRGIIQWIKILATPLLFFAIFEAIISGQFKGMGVKVMVIVASTNALCAILIALFISNYFQAGKLLNVAAISLDSSRTPALSQKLDWTESLKSFVPDSLVGPFVSNAVPTVIIIAILFGLAVKTLEGTEHAEFFERLRLGARALVKIHLKLLEWMICLVPLAVFASVAKVVGEHGFSLLSGLGAYLAVTLSGMALQIFIVYQAWIAGVARLSLRSFWKEAKEPVLYSFGVNSSLATLPVTLKSLDNLRVSPSASRLAACVGTNLNNDGILLYEVVAALFVAQAYGFDLSMWQQVALAGVCVMATLGVAGIPEAGIISLILVLNTTALPAEILPVLLTVDWIVARCRSVTNVLADMTVAVATDHLAAVEPKLAKAR